MFVTIESIEMHGWSIHLLVIYFTPPSSNKFTIKSARDLGLKSFHAAPWHQSLKLLFQCTALPGYQFGHLINYT